MCPNCGHAELSYHCGYSGDGWNEERIWEEWLICEKCGARTTNEELDRIGVDEPQPSRCLVHNKVRCNACYTNMINAQQPTDDLVETLWLIGTGKTRKAWGQWQCEWCGRWNDDDVVHGCKEHDMRIRRRRNEK